MTGRPLPRTGLELLAHARACCSGCGWTAPSLSGAIFWDERRGLMCVECRADGVGKGEARKAVRSPIAAGAQADMFL